MRALRADIQILRALAVLSVLVYHFELPGLNKGFLGVDIFFVISGYLMSGVIIRALDDTGHFDAAGFYLRRARRLLPAAFATLLATTMVAPFVLTPSLLADYASQLAGALTFSANFVLWQQSGYFDGHAELKPLLHTWSLALEEQFYFALPLVLVLTTRLAGRRAVAPVLLLLLLGSAATGLWWMPIDPSGTFYLLHTRAWELLIGSLCALPGVQAGVHRLAARIRPVDAAWVALPVLAWCLSIGVDATHPRGDAWLVCLATAGLILLPSAAMQSRQPWMRPLHWIGDRSYSLYLVHWPLIALAKNVWLEGVPAGVHLMLMLLSFVLAHASYEWVEQPMRRIDTGRALAARLLWLALPMLAASGLMWHKLQSPSSRGPGRAMDWQQALRPNYGFARTCDQERNYRPKPACANAARPRTLLWGDSHAMHLVPALLASSPPGGIAQATRSACAPLLDMARRMPHERANRAQRCMAFNESVLQHLAGAPHIEFVVLASRWHYLFTDPVFDAQGRRLKPDAETVARSLGATIRRIRQLGKKVILVSPPASIGPDADLGLCAERRALQLWTIMPSTDAQCAFPQQVHASRHAALLDMLSAASLATHTHVIRLDQLTCQQGRCPAMIDGQPLYRDANHLSHGGSQALGRRAGLGRLIATQAR